MDRELANKVAERLRTLDLQDNYDSEEPDLLNHVVSEVQNVLGEGYEIVSQSWSLEDAVEGLGCSFWPDIIVKKGQKAVLVLELKMVRATKSPAKAYEETIGQCLIYRAKYPQVIGFVLNRGVHNSDHTAFTSQVEKLLANDGISLVIRR